MDTNQKIVIATHELVYGVPQALRDYLIKKKNKQLMFIGLPFWDSRKSFFVIYRKGKKINEKVSYRNSFGILDYVLDFFQVFWWVYVSKGKHELFIGVDPLNCLAGLILKKLKKVNKVIFYTMDFVPIRFENKILNFIFHSVEKFCVKNCGEVWNVSPRMSEGREKYLGLSSRKYPQKFIPVGIWNEQIKKRSFDQVKKNQILFIGTILEKQGLQMVIDSLPEVIMKIKNAHLLIVGRGEYESFLIKKVSELNLKNNVTFFGWIKNRRKLDDMISESAIAVATYKPEKEILRNFTYFADPNKLKDYLGAGLPVIMTDISYNAREIARRNCGIIVKYEKKEITNAIIKLMSREDILRRYRMNALNYAKKLDWMSIYDNYFKN